MISGVSVFGGFSGDEEELSERNPDPETNNTVLSGDINAPGDSYHVVTANDIDFEGFEMIHLDGFTIEKGRADGSTEDTQQGGGIYCVGGGDVRINNCIIEDCHADVKGGGAAVIGSFPAFTLCTFRNNSAGDNVNEDRWGSGLFIDNANEEDDACLVYNCTFTGNAGPANGGVICVFDDDTTAQFPAVSKARIVNTLVYENIAEPVIGQHVINTNGGGLYVFGDAVTDLISCTFANNLEKGTEPNNARFAVTANAYNNETILIHNCIFWMDDTSRAVDINDGEEAIEVRYTYGINCGTSEASVCANEVQNEPKFVNSCEGDFRLRKGSPGIDEGDNNLVEDDVFDLDDDTATGDDNPDLDIEERIVDDDGDQSADVDLGTYEGGVCFADTNDDDVVDVLDLLAVLGEWGLCPACPEDVTGSPCPDDVVDVMDLLAVLGQWGECDPEEEPIADWSDLHDEAGISDEEYEDYIDVLQTGSQQDKDRWRCWYTWRIDCVANPPGGSSPCSGEDPFAGGLGGGGG